MKRYHRPAGHIGLGFALLAVSACGTKGGTVSGVVTYQGKPVTTGTVLFLGADKVPVRAPILNDGSYQVTNVPVGEAKIAVMVPPPSPPPRKDDPNPPRPSQPTTAIRPNYMNAETSGLSYTVTTGSQTHNIDMK
jgi:hypothetical protein